MDRMKGLKGEKCDERPRSLLSITATSVRIQGPEFDRSHMMHSGLTAMLDLSFGSLRYA